jgi:hypothetical protein
MVDTVKQRKPPFAGDKSIPSGRVKHDSHGNALWEWNGEREEANGNLDHLGLQVQDSAPAGNGKGDKDQTKKSVRSLYQIDHSGQEGPRKPRDLRALSRHIAGQRRQPKNKED